MGNIRDSLSVGYKGALYANVLSLVTDFYNTLITSCSLIMKAPFSLFFVVLLAIAEAVPNYRSSESQLRLPKGQSVNDHVFYNPADVEGQVYDYIIVGGGLTGLKAAARLTEEKDIRVLVIESGFWESDRSADVYDLTHYGRVFETAIDHKFATEIQAIDNRSQVVHSGHGLGGSTLLNGGTWSEYPLG